MIEAKKLEEITKAAREKIYNERLESLPADMEDAAKKGESAVFWDQNAYGPLKERDTIAFRNAGFEVIGVNDGITQGYWIEWVRD